jgi:hypothetical protein
MTEPTLKTALKAWAEQHNVRPSAFARALGYTPSYGWSLLRGQADVTPEMFGRFVLAYGTEAAEAVMQLAGLQTSALPQPQGAQAVPVVELAETQVVVPVLEIGG